MSLALTQAQAGSAEIPVGAVIVHREQAIAMAGNLREVEQDPTAHAEMRALQQAAQHLGRWNLSDCTLYVTLEPCPMCMGAILMARIPLVICGCRNFKLGAAGTVLPLHDFPGLSLRCHVEHGILEEECARLLKEFFRPQRHLGEVAEPG